MGQNEGSAGKAVPDEVAPSEAREHHSRQVPMRVMEHQKREGRQNSGMYTGNFHIVVLVFLRMRGCGSHM